MEDVEVLDKFHVAREHYSKGTASESSSDWEGWDNPEADEDEEDDA